MTAELFTIEIGITSQDIAAAFAEFWSHCPKKIGKPLCEAKFRAIVNGGLTTKTLDKDSGEYVTIHVRATTDELIHAMKAHRCQMIDEDKQYIPRPATWLNSGRWLDMEDDERDELAAKWDRIRARMNEAAE